MPRLDYKIGTTYLTGSGGRLKVISSRVVLHDERHIRLYTVEWIRGSGQKEMTLSQMSEHDLKGTRTSSGLDIDVPAGAPFRIVNTRRAGANKQYKIHWKDGSKRDEWISKAEVYRLIG